VVLYSRWRCNQEWRSIGADMYGILKEFLLKPGFVRTKLFRNTQKVVMGSIGMLEKGREIQFFSFL